MIIEYNKITIRYKDENILALKEDGPDMIIYLKNGNFHRLLGPQSPAPMSASLSPRIQKSPEDTGIQPNSSSTQIPSPQVKKKKMMTKSNIGSSLTEIMTSQVKNQERRNNEQSLSESSPVPIPSQPKKVQKTKVDQIQVNESMDQRYLNFIDECLKTCAPAKPFHYSDEEIKQYLLSRIKGFTLTIDLEEKNERKFIQYQLKVAKLIQEYRENPPLDCRKFSLRNSRTQERR